MSEVNSDSNNKSIKVLSSDILTKYHQGLLNSAEMNQVEKLLLEDPFAAEALEGMGKMGDNTKIRSIESTLNKKIEERVNQSNKKIIPIYQRPINIAAALLVLLISGYFIFSYQDQLNPANVNESPISLNNSKNEDKEEATEDENELQQDPLKSNQPTILESEEGKKDTAISLEEKSADKEYYGEKTLELTDTVMIAAAPKQQFDRKENAIETEPAIAPSLDIELAEEELAEAEIVEGADDIANKEAEVVKKVEVDEARTQQGEIADNSTQKPASIRLRGNSSLSKKAKKEIVDKDDLNARLIQGQVIAANNGLGMPGVSLNVKGSNRGVFTDINGFYQLKVYPTDTVLSFSFVGFESEEVKIKEASEINVDLEPESMALSEVVVTAYEDNDQGFIPVIGAAPLGGSAKFKKYLKDSLKYPQEAIQNKIEGKVKVTFNVDPNGRLTDFNVRRSLGYGCDEEVLRLIKSGPKWQAAQKGEEKVKQKVRVRVKFKLKK